MSFAEVAREALAEKARQYHPVPRSLGMARSGRSDISREAGVGRTPPR
ncbi:MAG: hypothetical protein ACRDVM_08710 [Acidimicrobiia bacterium]